MVKGFSGPSAWPNVEIGRYLIRLGAWVYPEHVSSLQDVKMVMRIQVKSHEESQAPALSLSDLKQPSAAEKPPMPDAHHTTGNKQGQMQRLVKQNLLLLPIFRLKDTVWARPWFSLVFNVISA